MTPLSGRVGTKATITITSSIILLDGDYEIRWSPAPSFLEDNTIVLSKGSVPDGGSAVTARFAIPEAKSGIHYIQYMRIGRNTPVNFQFNVRPSIKIVPSSAEPGTTVSINGRGFPADDFGTLTFDGELTGVRVVTDEMGSFTSKFTVPDTSVGEHEFRASALDLYGEAAKAILEVLPVNEPEVPKADGNVDASPSDDGKNGTVNLSRDSIPPRQPTPVSPMGHRFGMLGAKPVTFNWDGVSDPSSVTYTLEISDTVDFHSVEAGMRKTGLAYTSCTIRVEPGTHYWRVKAVDGAGNEGQWACAPYGFKVGELVILIQEFLGFLKNLNSVF